MEDFAFKITIDTTALERLAELIESLDAGIKAFATGVSEGMQTAADSIGTETVDALEAVKTKTAEISAQASKTSVDLQNLGRQWGTFISGIVLKLSGGVATAFSASALLSTYTKGVADVARMTGLYSEKLETWRKKRALLARVNREDIEIYTKVRRAMTNYSIAMGTLSTTIGRALTPVMQKGAESLEKLSNWIQGHSGDILRFLEVLAGVITAALIPALKTLALKALANPFTLFVAGVTAAALAIDDLIVYCQGGNAAFGRLWRQFGSGPELMAKFTTAMNAVKSTVSRVVDSISAMWEQFSLGERSMAVVDAFGSALNAVWGLISRVLDSVSDLFSLLGGGETLGAQLGNAFDLIALALDGVAWAAKKLTDVWDYLSGSTGNAVADLRNAWQGFADWLLGLWTGLTDKISGWIDGLLSPFKSIYNKVFGSTDTAKAMTQPPEKGKVGAVANAITETAVPAVSVNPMVSVEPTVSVNPMVSVEPVTPEVPVMPVALEMAAGAADAYDRLNTAANEVYNNSQSTTRNEYTQSDNRTQNIYVSSMEEAELIVKAPSFLDSDFALSDGSAW